MILFALLLLGVQALTPQLRPNDESSHTAHLNSLNLTEAIYAANASLTDKNVIIPPGKYYLLGPIVINQVYNVKITLHAEFIFKSNIQTYPSDNGYYADLWTFFDCHYIQFIGTQEGSIDGSGYEWWLQSILFAVKMSKLESDHRPRLLTFKDSSNLYFNNLNLWNSRTFILIKLLFT